MKTLKTALGTGVIGAVLLAAGFAQWGPASAQTVSGPQAANDGSAGIACVAAAGSWTDCTLTLNRSIPAGGSLTASLPRSDGMVAYCSDGSSDDPACGVSGNAAVFLCQQGCDAGTRFIVSAYGASGVSVAYEFSIAGSATIDLSPRSPGLRQAPLGIQQDGL